MTNRNPAQRWQTLPILCALLHAWRTGFCTTPFQKQKPSISRTNAQTKNVHTNLQLRQNTHAIAFAHGLTRRTNCRCAFQDRKMKQTMTMTTIRDMTNLANAFSADRSSRRPRSTWELFSDPGNSSESLRYQFDETTQTNQRKRNRSLKHLASNKQPSLLLSMLYRLLDALKMKWCVRVAVSLRFLSFLNLLQAGSEICHWHRTPSAVRRTSRATSEKTEEKRIL